MGISSKKTTSEQTNHSVQTPNVPQWGVDSLQGLNTQIEGIAHTDPNSFVTGPSALQTQAFDGAGHLDGWKAGNAAGSDLASRTAGTAAPQSSAAGIFDNGISQYLNPELDNVVKTSLADFDQGAGQTRARQAAAGANAGAFGGSRWGLQEGETEGQLARGRGALDSGLRSAAYGHATDLANADAGRRQQTNLSNADLQNSSLNRNTTISELLGKLSNDQNANTLADVTTQNAVGGVQRGISQDKATAPISLAQTIAQLLSQQQLPLLTGQTVDSHGTGSTTQNPSTFSQIGQGIQTAANLASLFSDERLKRDIVPLGKGPHGLMVYLYRYLWSPVLHAGVMAQEVLKVKPEAVTRHPSGFLMVNYGAL